MEGEVIQQVDIEKLATINVANKIRNTSLSKYQGLMPLYELISNSIHAIDERKKAGLMDEGGQGSIIVTIIRNGDPNTLASISDDDKYPIQSIVVEDNGIGMNDENLRSFTEADSDHKLSIGGKGLGRFVCLKAFKYLSVESTYNEGKGFKKRQIKLKNSRVGFEGFQEEDTPLNEYRTICTLYEIYEKYVKFTPKPLSEIASHIITHFQLYFISGEMPHIVVRNQNNDEINLNTWYRLNFNSKVTDDGFDIGDDHFTVYLSKSNSANSHRIHFCAQNRSVKDEWLGKPIIELGKKPVRENDASFFYAAFVVSEALDCAVSNERTGFTFPEVDDEDNEDIEELTLSKIRKKAVATIESMIADYIEQARTAKMESYRQVVNSELPQYRAVLHHKADKVKRLV